VQLIFVNVFLAAKDREANTLILGASQVRSRLGELGAQITHGLGWRIRVEVNAVHAAKHGAHLAV